MRKKRQVAIYGAGGFAREVAWLLSMHEGCEIYECVGYVDDDPNRKAALNGKPVFSWEQFANEYPHTLISIGVGDPRTRYKIAQKCSQAGFEFATLVHHSVKISEFVSIGKGSTVCCGSILTVDISLGEQVHINLDCTVGHDVTIGPFTTLAPGVHVSGNVKIGSSVYIGTGANIINGTPDEPLVIHDGCVVGAGACITTNTEAHTLYVGVPAQPKKRYA